MFSVPSPSRLKRLLSRYYNLTHLSALLHIDISSVCLWCAVYGFKNKKLRKCRIKAENINEIRKNQHCSEKLLKLSSYYGLNKQQLEFILEGT